MTKAEGKVAIVTGGGRGIGRAICLALAGAGYAIGVLARSQNEIDETVRLVENEKGRAVSLVADVTDHAQVKAAIQRAESLLGPVDALVNNAGAVNPFGPFWESDPEAWWKTIDVNLRGAMLCTHVAIAGMVGRHRGRIVNISSGAGTMASPYFSSYVVSKTALVRFTECVSIEAKSLGISAFVIAPGTVRTAMSEYSLNSAEGQKWLPWFRRIFDEKIDVPAERPARLVAELLSGRCDALSGRMISIFDDLEMLRAQAAEIEQQNLYSLKLEKLKGVAANPAQNILAASRSAAKQG